MTSKGDPNRTALRVTTCKEAMWRSAASCDRTGKPLPYTSVQPYHLGDHKNSDYFCALVERIIATLCPEELWAGPLIVLVVDNYIIHHSKQTTKLLQHYADRLNVVALHLRTETKVVAA
jgi:hypothetical protein